MTMKSVIAQKLFISKVTLRKRGKGLVVVQKYVNSSHLLKRITVTKVWPHHVLTIYFMFEKLK